MSKDNELRRAKTRARITARAETKAKARVSGSCGGDYFLFADRLVLLLVHARLLHLGRFGVFHCTC